MEPRAQLWIAEKGGTITAESYLDAVGVLRIGVKCTAGHEWSPRVANLASSHSWCPTCYGNEPLTIEMMCAIAVDRGGLCLSTVYNGNKKHLEWKCALGHCWEATPNNVKNLGSWCPHCVFNVGEELMRAALEEALLGRKFNRTRSLPWMEHLELDAYNEEMKLAAEYQGVQHYKRVAHFQRNEGEFEAQLDRDALTAQRCEKAGVTLLVVPHFVGHKNLRAHVRHELLELGLTISPMVGSDAEFYDRIRAQGPAKDREYARVAQVAIKKGGICLSTRYVSYTTPMLFRCRFGHEFDATPESICQPPWRGTRFCRVCGGTQR